VSARSAGTEYLHPSRSTIPPTPPTRDRLRLEPYTDRNGTRFGLVGLLSFDLLDALSAVVVFSALVLCLGISDIQPVDVLSVSCDISFRKLDLLWPV